MNKGRKLSHLTVVVDELQNLLLPSPQAQTYAERAIDPESLRVLKSLGYIQ